MATDDWDLFLLIVQLCDCFGFHVPGSALQAGSLPEAGQALR